MGKTSKHHSRKARKSYEGWRQRHVSELQHMLRCCEHGRLPPTNIDYLEIILRDPHHLPKPKEIAKRVQLTYEQQQTNKLFTIPATDKTKEELAELHRAKDAERKRLARLRAGRLSREQYRASVASEKPWEALGIKKSAYYKRKAKERLKCREAA